MGIGIGLPVLGGGHAGFAFKHFQEVKIILKPAGGAGFCNGVARAEHAFGLVHPQDPLHLLDRHAVHSLEDGVQAAVSHAKGGGVILVLQLPTFVVVNILQDPQGRPVFPLGPQPLFLHGQTELVQDRLDLGGEEFLAEKGRGPVAGRVLHQVKAGELQRDLPPQWQQDMAVVQLRGRRGLCPLCLEMGKIGLVLVMLQAIMPHIGRQQEKFAAVDHMVLPIDAEGPCPADHQHQNPLGHHPVRVYVPAAEFVHDFHMDLPRHPEPPGKPLSGTHRCRTRLFQYVHFIIGRSGEKSQARG